MFVVSFFTYFAPFFRAGLMQKFSNVDDVSRVLQELSDEERDNTWGELGFSVSRVDRDYDFSDESEGENEQIEANNYSSDSEQSDDEDWLPNSDIDDGEDINKSGDTFFDDENVFDVFIGQGKQSEVFWLSNSPSLPSRTAAKNIVKVLPGPTFFARNVKSELEIFLKLFSEGMIDSIVNYTNLYIEKRKSEGKIAPDSYYSKLTSRSELMGLMGILILLSLNKSCSANAANAWKTNGTGLIVCRAAFSLNRF